MRLIIGFYLVGISLFLASGVAAKTTGTDAAARYTGFSITSPTSDQGVRANDGNVTVQLSLQPALQSGHTLILSVSGEGSESTTDSHGLTIGLKHLSRGLHTVTATVVDKEGNDLIKTTSVSFHVLRVGGG